MSKKKISQIVGLTIGATAIAATGIGSSIALTSCTGEQQVASVTNFTLDNDNLTTAYDTIADLVKSSANTPDKFASLDGDDLNSNLKQLIFKGSVATELAKVPTLTGFGESNIQNIIFSVVDKNEKPVDDPTTTYVQSKAISVDIVFSDNVTLPNADSLPSNMEIDGSNSQQINFTDAITINNPTIINLDANQDTVNAIMEGVQESVIPSGEDNVTYSDLNNSNVQILVKSNVATNLAALPGYENFKSDDIQGIHFETSGSGSSLDVSYQITFNDNINLGADWSGDLTVSDSDSQTLEATNAFQIKNGSYDSYVLDASSGDGIFNAVKNTIANYHGTDYNSPAFQQQAKKAITDTGVSFPTASINSITVNAQGTGTNSANLSATFSIAFGADVVFKNWNNSSIFSYDEARKTLTTKNSFSVPNPNASAVTIDASQANTIYTNLSDAITSATVSGDDLSAYLNGAFQTDAKTAIKNAVPGLDDSFIQTINFKVNNNTTDNALLNVSFEIVFSDNVAVSASGNNVVANGHSLSSLTTIQAKNPAFSQLVLNNDNVETIYSALNDYLNSQPNGFNLTQLQSPSSALIQDCLRAIVTGFNQSNHDTPMQLVDIANLNFIPTINQADDTKLDVNFSLGFNPNNVSVDASVSSANMVGQVNGLRSSHPISVKNNQVPPKTTIDATLVSKMADVIKNNLVVMDSSRLTDALNSDTTIISGLKQTLASGLDGMDGVVNFSAQNIKSIQFSFSTDQNTNMISVVPTISFNQVTINNGNGYTVQGNTIVLDAITLKQGDNAFINQASLDKINDLIVQGYNSSFGDNPSQVNQVALDNNSFIQSIIQSILTSSDLANAHLSASNLNLSFKYNQADSLTTSSVSYSLTFSDNTGFAPNLTGNGYNFVDKTLSSATPISVSEILSFGDAQVAKVYQTIQDQINGIANKSDINDSFLNNKVGDINNALNSSLPSGMSNIISSLSFSVDNQANQATALVTFSDQVVINSFTTANCSPVDSHKIQMVFNGLGISNCVSSSMLSSLASSAGSWITSQSTQAIADGLNINNFISSVSGIISPSLIDPSASNFSVAYGSDNNVTLTLKFSDDAILPSSVAGVNGFDASAKTLTITKNVPTLNTVLSQDRFDILTNISSNLDTIYDNAQQENNNFANIQTALTKLSSDLSTNLTNAGLESNLVTDVNFSTNLNPNDSLSIHASFNVAKNAIIPASLNYNNYTKTQSADNYSFANTTDYENAVSRTVVSDNTLMSLYNTVQNVAVPQYQLTLLPYQRDTWTPIYDSVVAGFKTQITKQFVANNHLDDLGATVTITNTNDPTAVNSGDLLVKVTFANKDKINWVDCDNNPYFDIDPTAGTITSKANAPIPCGTGIFVFNGNTITGLTDKGRGANQLVLGAYANVHNIAPGAFANSQAYCVDFSQMSFENNFVPNVFSSGNTYNTSVKKVILSKNTNSSSNNGNWKLSDNLFKGCTNLRTVENLWNQVSVQAIPAGLFDGCTNYSDPVVINGWIRSFDPSAFNGCTKIQSIDMFDSVFNTEDKIGAVIKGATNVTSIVMPHKLDDYFGSFKPNGSLATSLKGLTQPFDLTFSNPSSIPAGYFGNYNGVDNSGIKIRSLICDDILNLGEYAFKNNTNLVNVRCNAAISLSTTKTVPQYCFFGCTNLTNCDFLTGNSAVTTLKLNAFNRCKSLSNVVFSNNLAWFSQGCFAYAIIKAAPNNQLSLYGLKEGSNGYNGLKMRLDPWAFLDAQILNSDGSDIKYSILSPGVFPNIQYAISPNQFIDGNNSGYSPWGNGVLVAADSSTSNSANTTYQDQIPSYISSNN